MRVSMNGLTITYTSSLSKARDLADHYENQGFGGHGNQGQIILMSLKIKLIWNF